MQMANRGLMAFDQLHKWQRLRTPTPTIISGSPFSQPNVPTGDVHRLGDCLPPAWGRAERLPGGESQIGEGNAGAQSQHRALLRQGTATVGAAWLAAQK